MNKTDRRKKLNELKNDESAVVSTGISLRYQGRTTQDNKVYRIPLEFLIYNKHNGRIGSVVQSYEAQHGEELNPEIEHDRLLIERFLYESRKDRNKTTMASLLKDRQQKHGIVTADGVIVDGNRRAMLLNKLFHERESLGYSFKEVEHCQYFDAIILPDGATEKDMHQLETIYQMGEDDKVDYNAIEKYLKCKELRKYFEVKDIADFMNEKPSQIEEWLGILELMEDYLSVNEYDGIYTCLEKREGQFVDLRGYIESYKRGGSNTNVVDWDYDETDISDLTSVCFDYIRAKYEGKEFREIAKTGKDGSIFAFEEIWKAFLSEHEKNRITSEESVAAIREKNPSADLTKLLHARDEDWAKEARSSLQSNLKWHSDKVEERREKNNPKWLLKRALSALEAIDLGVDSLYNDEEAEDYVKKISSIVWEIKKGIDRS